MNRTLGAVSLLGPLRMDYATAIQSVRAAADELSRFAESLLRRQLEGFGGRAAGGYAC